MIGTDGEYSWNARDIGDRIAKLTMQEFCEVVAYTYATYGISLSASVNSLFQNPAESPDPTAQFDIRIENLNPDRKIGMIKLVREFTRLGLKEAKDLVESVPTRLGLQLSKTEAESMRRDFLVLDVRATVVQCDGT